jgi:hypothetical protein
LDTESNTLELFSRIVKDPEPWPAKEGCLTVAIFEMLKTGKYISAVLYTVYKIKYKLNGIRGASPKQNQDFEFAGYL